MAKIQLISAPIDADWVTLDQQGAYAPLNMIWLASYLRADHDVEVIDGYHSTLRQIQQQIDAPIVGISFTAVSTGALDEIARTAKERGATVVVGGQAATPLADQLLRGNPDIDYVVRFDGEEALLHIANGREPETIPNLSFRNGAGHSHNPTRLVDLTELPSVTWSINGIDVPRYWHAFGRLRDAVTIRHDHLQPLNTVLMKGCPMRQGGKGCSFCSRIDTELRAKSPRQAYDEFRYLAQLGADRIEDFSDSWLHNSSWLRELGAIVVQEGHWGPKLRVYGDVRYLTPEVLDLLQPLGVESVVLGIESGNEEVLRRNGKPISRRRILDCMRRLGNAGFLTLPSFVLGMIGENEQSLADTFAIADEILSLCTAESVYFSVMMPFPGSIAWNQMMEDAEMRRRHSGYRINTKQLQRDFLARYTDLKLEFIQEELENWQQQAEAGSSMKKAY